LSPLITVNIEAHVSFWLAFLVPLLAILISTTVFLVGSPRYIKNPPSGSAILDAMRVSGMAIREKGFDKIKPAELSSAGKLGKYAFTSKPQYTEEYVDEVKRGVRACKVRSSSVASQVNISDFFHRCSCSSPSTSFAGSKSGTT
jgi:POT family proton-dependent oligopeptide transporter